MRPQPSRRTVLRSGALAALGGLAGCLNGSSSLGGTPEPNPMRRIPEPATLATHTDVDALLADDGARAVANAWLEARSQSDFYAGPSNIAAALEQIESDTGLDPRAASWTTSFAGISPESDGYGGLLVAGDWSPDAVVSALTYETRSYTERSYNDAAVYEPSTDWAPWIGVVADGQFAIGNRSVVEDAIDVAAGELPAMPEQLRDGYANTRDGPAGFVSDVPAEHLPEEVAPGERTFDLTLLHDVRYVAGRVFASGSNRGVAVRFRAADQETAGDLVSVLEGLVAVAHSQADEGIVTDALDAISVRQEGPLALLTYEQSVDELEAMAADLGEPSDDRIGGPPVEAPQVAFGFEYDADARTVTITHEGGDAVARDELFVAGRGFVDVDGADMTEPGRWAGTASGGADDDEDVVAGDAVVVGATSDYELLVLWDAEDDNATATLASNDGPDA